MPNTKGVEIAVGMFVAAGLAALLLLAMKVSNLSSFTAPQGYVLTAEFQNIGGLKVRAPVTVGGVQVGRVISIGFNNTNYEAVVKMAIDPKYDKFPVDTSAAIYTAGLLGEKYVALVPGGAPTFLKNGDRIKLTQSALILEQVIGQYLFNRAGGQK